MQRAFSERSRSCRRASRRLSSLIPCVARRPNSVIDGLADVEFCKRIRDELRALGVAVEDPECDEGVCRVLAPLECDSSEAPRGVDARWLEIDVVVFLDAEEARIGVQAEPIHHSFGHRSAAKNRFCVSKNSREAQ
ncbi:MAG: hypothetical protein R3B99_28565 [Polyangiales bacterium]